MVCVVGVIKGLDGEEGVAKGKGREENKGGESIRPARINIAPFFY